MQIAIDKLYIVAFCDPKGANPNTKGTSRAAIEVVGMDDLERIFILQSWAAFCGTDEILNRIFRLDEKWQPPIFGIDTTATQNIWPDLIRKEAELRGVKPPRLRAVNFRGQKRHVIETVLQPIAAAGKLFRPLEGEVKELKGEWNNFPGGIYRDALDALAHAILLLPRHPIEHTRELERQNYARYLGRSGLSADEIQRRMREIGA